MGWFTEGNILMTVGKSAFPELSTHAAVGNYKDSGLGVGT